MLGPESYRPAVLGYLDGCRSGHTRSSRGEARGIIGGPGLKDARLLHGFPSGVGGTGRCKSGANMSFLEGSLCVGGGQCCSLGAVMGHRGRGQTKIYLAGGIWFMDLFKKILFI